MAGISNAERDKRRRSEYNKERYWWYRDHGICHSCGIAYVEPGHVTCHACYLKQMAAKNKSDPTGDRRRRLQHELRERRKAAGLCVDCGKPTNGHLRCDKHLAAQRESNYKQKILHMLDEEVRRARNANGNSAVPG